MGAASTHPHPVASPVGWGCHVGAASAHPYPVASLALARIAGRQTLQRGPGQAVRLQAGATLTRVSRKKKEPVTAGASEPRPDECVALEGAGPGQAYTPRAATGGVGVAQMAHL